jgi:arsenate reductase (thioredoxin)
MRPVNNKAEEVTTGGLSGKTSAAKSVLFVCIENSSRSIMAEGFANVMGLRASSAGTFPARQTNVLVVQVMAEEGIDVSQNKPKELTEKMIDAADLVVLTDASLGKAIPGNLRRRMKKKSIEWSIPDPQGKGIEEIRFIRDQIRRIVSSLVASSGR